MIQILDSTSVTFRNQNQRSYSELRIHIQDSDQDCSEFNINLAARLRVLNSDSGSLFRTQIPEHYLVFTFRFRIEKQDSDSGYRFRQQIHIEDSLAGIFDSIQIEYADSF